MEFITSFLGNGFNQIAVGLLPAALVFVGLAVFSAKGRLRSIIAAGLLAACCAAGFIVGGVTGADSSGGKSGGSSSVKPADDLCFAYALMSNGAADLAEDVIRDARSGSVYSDEYTLALARAKVLDGKEQAAAALYAKLPDIEPESKDDIMKGVEDYLDGKKSKDYLQAAEIAVFAEEAYDEFLSNDALPSELSGSIKDLMKLYEKTPELLRIPKLRIARLKLQLLDEDFSGIAKSVDEYADYNELLIVSELYMNGYIKPKNFSKNYAGDTSRYSRVIETLQEVFDTKYEDAGRDEKNAAKNRLRSLRAFLQNPALMKTVEKLQDYAEGDFAYDRSKVFLQLAKIENYLGDTSLSNMYIDKSLNTVGDCGDSQFTAPMYEIIGIIADKDDPERLKDVAMYTERILSNTMTIRMSDELTAPAGSAEGIESRAGGEGSGSGGNDFSMPFNTYISQKRMALNIVSVDPSEFTKVSAMINVNSDLSYSAEQLKSILKVRDCDIDIKDFTIEKVSYSAANILICADVSGSMDGVPIADLRNAIKMFVESSEAIESVALVTFNDSVRDVWAFGTPSSELIAAAESLRAGGNTDMYSAVQNVLQYFSGGADSVNCVILISDGEDNYPADYSEIQANVGAPYKAKGVTLYSLGLGSGAAGDYLNALAGSTGGNYVYATDSAQIQAFFDGIRAQILNSYRLTFTAEDTFRNARNLRVSIEGESYTYDEFWYTLDGSEINKDGETEPLIYLKDKVIYGFEEKLIFKGEKSRKLNFLVGGFEPSDVVVLSLDGKIDYDALPIEFVNENTYSVTIPAGIACDTYDVKVTINGMFTMIRDGLTVAVQGSEQSVVFGPYVFTAYSVVTEDDVTTLSDHVVMNGWLRFKGEVRLEGDLEGDSIVMRTSGASYAHYYQDTAEGLASMFVNKDVPIPALGSVTLYNQYLFTGADGGEGGVRVEPVSITSLGLPGFLRFTSPGLSLYPDRVEIKADAFSTDLPFQGDILKGVGLFSFKTDISGSIGAKSIDVIIDIGEEFDTDRDHKLIKNPFNLGNIPIFMNTAEFAMKLDTYANEFYIKYMAAMPFTADDGDFGASLRWKWGDSTNPGIHFDEFKLYADVDVPIKGNPVDLTFSNFSLGIIDMTSHPKLVGGFDVEAYKINSVIPGIGKWLGEIGEASALSAEDCTVSIGLDRFCIEAKTTIKALKFIELGGAEVQLGRFDYTNVLLHMDKEEVAGIRASLTAGPAIHTSNCDIAMQGTVDIVATNRVILLPAVQGNIDIAVKWWVFTKDFHAQGVGQVGVEFTHDNDTVFFAQASGGKNVFFIQYSLKRGADYGKKSL